MPLFKIVNFGLFQAGWFIAALMHDGSNWILPALVVFHFVISPEKHSDAILLLVLLPIGLVIEVAMISLGLIEFNSALALPIWMVGVWCLLILSFNHSLQWFREIPLALQIILSGGFAVASYFGAQRLDAINIGEPQLIMGAAIGLVWAIQLPMMMMITKKINAEKSHA